ncbi:DUF2971 domain-containing protein [Neisseria animaloris]|nr:DUF2971 domain-containing protein [Neisseria animaloris]
MKNYLFFKEDELDKKIYRIFPIDRFFEILEKKQLVLVKPKLWDDPFENLLLSSKFRMDDGEIVGFASRDSVYGQCWTWHRESDAMWRIYSQHKNGIRVQSTPRKLLLALHAEIGNFASIRGFIGKVRYQSTHDLLKSFMQIDLFNTSGSGMAQSLLYKRKAFSHEKEVRLIYFGEDGKCQNNLFQFGIDPNDLFDSLLFDPRMNNHLKESYRSQIRKMNCNVRFMKSSLYQPPEEFTFEI